MKDILLQGIGASIITIIGTYLIEWIKRKQGRNALYAAILAECRYDLSIVDEMRKGMIEANGTFKRMSVEFFKEIRIQSSHYMLNNKVLSELSRVIVNLELYNREADCVFDGKSDTQFYTGVTGGDEICFTRKSIPPDLSLTAKYACQGVKDSLNDLINIVNKVTRKED